VNLGRWGDNGREKASIKESLLWIERGIPNILFGNPFLDKALNQGPSEKLPYSVYKPWEEKSLGG